MKLLEIKELLSKISPWPWVRLNDGEGGHVFCKKGSGEEGDFAWSIDCDKFDDSEFIAKSPEIIDKLVTQLEKAKIEIQKLKEENEDLKERIMNMLKIEGLEE